MGNDQSTVLDEERKMLESLYQIAEGRLDGDHVDVNSKLNRGTAAPNCQPSHTLRELEEQKRREEEEAERLASLLDIDDSRHAQYLAEHGSLSEQQQQQPQQPPEKGSIGSYVQMAKTGYQELVNAIIRPPRANYRDEHLGPPAFTFLGRRFTRTDFTLQTNRGLNLQCSHWEPIERTADKIPVVIYMHGNASARVEVLPQLTCLLALGVAVFAFDFAGSGKSDGQHVSLGYYEREDLMCVVAHLRATDVVSTIALWGRSMGAVTALLHGDRDPSIAGMVLDSPFADLTQLCEEMVDKARDHGINVPGFVTSVAIRMIRGSVRRQADFDIKDVCPLQHAEHCFIPALFVAGENDDFITKSHSLMLHDRHAGDANMIVVDGDHNSTRPRFMFDSVSIFLQACLQIPPDWQLHLDSSMTITSPPWRFPGTYKPMEDRDMAIKPSSRMHSVTSPTRKSAEGSDSDTDKNVEVVATSEDFDHQEVESNIDVENLGMTSERQKEIQGSLFRMLGHESEDDSPIVDKSAL